IHHNDPASRVELPGSVDDLPRLIRMGDVGGDDDAPPTASAQLRHVALLYEVEPGLASHAVLESAGAEQPPWVVLLQQTDDSVVDRVMPMRHAFDAEERSAQVLAVKAARLSVRPFYMGFARECFGLD